MPAHHSPFFRFFRGSWHGVERYPFGNGVQLDLRCAARKSPADEPDIRARASCDVELLVKWAGGQKTREFLELGQHKSSMKKHVGNLALLPIPAYRTAYALSDKDISGVNTVFLSMGIPD